jgi:hypothetical protein
MYYESKEQDPVSAFSGELVKDVRASEVVQVLARADPITRKFSL